MPTDDELKSMERKAFDMLLSELVERLLSLSDNPRRSSDFIAEELRALVGARTVMVFQCGSRRSEQRHRLVSVYPERRRSLGEDERIEELLTLSHKDSGARIVERGEGSDESRIFAELGSDESMVVPLTYGAQRVGAILLFDLLDKGTADKIFDTIDQLSSVFALILRNADLYATMEDKVAERTRELEASLREKDALLKEVHHRVKNNLQIVLSFLYLKENSPICAEAKTILAETQDRVFAMALAHEELYRTGDFSGIDLADYLTRIADSILESSCPNTRRSYRTETLRLELKDAIPCGLIVSELVMNSAKHAFARAGGGQLTLNLGRSGNDASVEVADDGPGFPAEGSAAAVGGGIGLSIIETLVDQLHGRIEYRRGGPGASAVLLFPLPSETLER